MVRFLLSGHMCNVQVLKIMSHEDVLVVRRSYQYAWAASLQDGVANTCVLM
jgi:hypothetical protein